MTLTKKLILFLLAPLFFFSSAFCQSDFKLSFSKDAFLLGTGIALSGGDLILDNLLKINRQEYDPSKVYNRDDVNAFDRLFMREYSHSLDKYVSNAFLFSTVATPLVLFPKTEKEEWKTITFMYAETLLIANGLKELTKLAINRARPFMYFEPSTYPKDDIEDGDWANSFLSGHTTMAFAGATFTSYVFYKYFPGSQYKYAVVASSYALACATGLFRILAGKHFVTDVLAGAVLGSAVGYLVPWLHSSVFNDDKIRLSVLPSGFVLKFSL
ncbi:phosphatase PAP2 family protein [Treponema pectinovorum]|uniref:phosphatase PAP2 family protein n=1 Tax=Treponema pectinovorum TaxID=164 RepID=UPI0011F3C1C9|nr:phosphatase PAP2 family protein [Treponema pectinovorum]